MKLSKKTDIKKYILKGFIALFITLCLTLININNIKAYECNEICESAGFNDERVYSSVVSDYNNNKMTSLDYKTDKLSDEQLKEVTSLIISANLNETYDLKGIEKLTNLINVTIRTEDITDSRESFITLNNLDFSENVQLEIIDILGANLGNGINLSNNTMLISLKIGYCNLNEINISNLMDLEELDLSNNNLTEINLSNNENLNSISLSSNKLKKINVENNLNIEMLYAVNNELEKIDLSKNLLLTDLRLRGNNLKKIDLSNNKELSTIIINDNNFYSFDDFLVGDSIKIDDIVKLPNTQKITYDIKDESIAKVEDGYLKILSSGTTDIEIINEYNGKKSMTFNSTINASYINSSKYDVNNEEKYIFVGSDDDKTIIKNISSKDMKLSIEDNKLIVKDDSDKMLLEYTLIRVSSDKYNLDNDTIKTDSKFNLDDINVINGTKEYKDGILSIIYNNKVVKKYNVIEPEVVNPKTGDNIIKYILICFIALIAGLITSILIAKNRKNN